MTQTKAVTVRKKTAVTPSSKEQADLWELAQKLFQSDYRPKRIKNAKSLLYILMMGQDLGWTPTQSLANITVINDKPSVYADGLTAILHEAGHKLEETETGSIETDDLAITCTVTRHDTGTVISRTFSVDKAKRAGLWQTEAVVKKYNRNTREHYETANDSPWWKYPDRMIWRRAISWAVRDSCSDKMHGVQVVEEMEDHLVTIETTRDDAEKPSRLAQKLKGNNPEAYIEEPETVSEDVDEPEVEDAVILEDFTAEPERPLTLNLIDRPDAFKENLEAFSEFYGYGGEQFGTNEKEDRADPEVVYFNGVTYRTYRDVCHNYDEEKPEAKYERPALNDSGALCFLSLAIIEKFASPAEEEPEDETSGDLTPHEERAPAEDSGSPATSSASGDTDASPPGASDAADKGARTASSSVSISVEADDWLNYCADKDTTFDMLSDAWPIEQDLEWFKVLNKAQQEDVRTTTEATIQALKGEEE